MNKPCALGRHRVYFIDHPPPGCPKKRGTAETTPRGLIKNPEH
jgi:hypothetical protein